MQIHSWLRRGLRIARVERTRSRRQLGRSTTRRVTAVVVLLAVAFGAGIGTHRLGAAIVHGDLTLPLETVRAAGTGAFLVSVVVCTQQASRRLERIDTELLLTTGPVRDLVLGMVCYSYRRIAVPVGLLVSSAAVGFALGARSPASVGFVSAAIVGFVALAALFGVVFAFATKYITARVSLFFRYRSALTYVLLGLGWLGLTVVVAGGLVPVGHLEAVARRAPSAWFVDLGLLALPALGAEPLRGLGALLVIAGGLPIGTFVAIALAERVVVDDAVGTAPTPRSRSIVGDGLSTRLFGGYVSRPVLTVARKRWVQERRVSRALLTGICVPFFGVSAIGIYALAALELPAITPIIIAFVCAVGVGQGFGVEVIGTEYPALPMTLTSISGRRFAAGTVLAGVAIGGPLTAIATLVAGLLAPVGLLETIVTSVASLAWCLCSLAVATALGTDTSYRDFWRSPYPFASVPVYAEIGRTPFVRFGLVAAALGLVCLPAWIASLPLVADTTASILGISSAAVRIGSILSTIPIALVVSRPAFERATRSFDRYTIR